MMTRTLVHRAVLLIFLSLILASTAPVVVRARRLDCTRFVFAPKCRGVAAKRSGPANTIASEDTSSEALEPYADTIIAVGDTPREVEESERLLRFVMDLTKALRQPLPSSARAPLPPAGRQPSEAEENERRESKELISRLLRS